MARIGSITIRGQRFTVYRRAKVVVGGVEVDASCDPPDRTRRAICISEGLTPERELDVLIHEMLHAAYWDLDETAIAETATDVAKALLSLGYSKTTCSGIRQGFRRLR